MSATDIVIGPYVVGEIPAPLEYQFLDYLGAPINLTGYTAKFQIGERGNTAPFINVVTRNATVTDAVNGKVTYTWTSADLTTPGPYAGMFWVGNLTQKYASLLITWTVCAGVGPAPAI